MGTEGHTHSPNLIVVRSARAFDGSVSETRRLYTVGVAQCICKGCKKMLKVEPKDGRIGHAELAEDKCFKAEDKEHLLRVIESGMGGIAAFNKSVRHTSRTATLQL